MNQQNMDVLVNVIGAVESGGQVYGRRDYAAYTPPYTNSEKEHTITLGWAQNYGAEAKRLIEMIFTVAPEIVWQTDSDGSILEMLGHDWVAEKWNPTDEQVAVLRTLLISEPGKKCQDELFMFLMNQFIQECAEKYTDDVKAQMMYCEIRHLGGRSAAERIFDRLNGKYDLNSILASLAADQHDKSSDNQVGDARFWGRHLKCKLFIEEHAVDETKEGDSMSAENTLAKIALAEEGYLEKKDGSKPALYDKKKNAGENNYTKYWDEIKSAYQGQAWCLCFIVWCYVRAFTKEVAKKLLYATDEGWTFYTPTQAARFKTAGRWFDGGVIPQPGWLVFFKNSMRIHHIALVYAVDQQKKIIYTIEGNTSNSTEVIANGGAVCKKAYAVSNANIAGYGAPDYSIVGQKYVPGWNSDSNGWWYADSESTYLASCWKDINGHRYYFGKDGYAVTGWQQIDGKWYYFEPRKGHPLECGLYVTDANGVQDVGEFPS